MYIGRINPLNRLTTEEVTKQMRKNKGEVSGVFSITISHIVHLGENRFQEAMIQKLLPENIEDTHKILYIPHYEIEGYDKYGLLKIRVFAKLRKKRTRR